MGIKVENLIKTNGIWQYDYTYDVTNKEMINDEFFDQIGFATRAETGLLNRVWVFNHCDAQNYDLIKAAQDIIQCPQQISIQINDAFKFAQATYRYVAKDFTQMCTDIYQDPIKITFSLKGTGNCEINEVDQTTLIYNSINFVKSVVGTEYDDFFDKIRNGQIYCVQQANIEAGIINNAFSTLSYAVDAMVLPSNFKKSIDNNEVFDISLECNVDGKMAIGKVNAQHKRYSVYNRGQKV